MQSKNKKRILALSLAGMMFVSSGCTTGKKDKKSVPDSVAIGHPISRYCIDGVEEGKVTRFYNTNNVYLLFNKETYDVTELLYASTPNGFIWNDEQEVYELESGEMFAYTSGVGYNCNFNDYTSLLESNYLVRLTELSAYVEGESVGEFCSLSKIRELEPKIVKSLKIINRSKIKTIN